MENNLRQRLEEFLAENNQPPVISQLTPDASTREYFRVRWFEKPAIGCVYPFNDLCKGQFDACLDVTNVFLTANLPVAKIFASDAEKAIIIHEDFGDTILRDVLLKSDETERERLLNEAITMIAKIQAATKTAFELNSISSKLKFDEEKLLWELNFFKTHYFESLMKTPLSEIENEAIEKEFIEIAWELESHAKVLTHRDFHAANLMLEHGEIKIIDHQDARLGSTTYDLVSLLLDRVTILPTPEWLAEKRRFFLDERESLGLETLDEQDFSNEFRLQTIQRCLKAIGTFSFQSTFRQKTYFIQYIKPMFQIVLRACENLNRFPNLQKILGAQINE
ncbi:MAG: phosphotransferase [Pyrinomonadaceae bacterium]|nr:phosphotransferase [Pyrinomonadaceae bacterium]